MYHFSSLCDNGKISNVILGLLGSKPSGGEVIRSEVTDGEAGEGVEVCEPIEMNDGIWFGFRFDGIKIGWIIDDFNFFFDFLVLVGFRFLTIFDFGFEPSLSGFRTCIEYV